MLSIEVKTRTALNRLRKKLHLGAPQLDKLLYAIAEMQLTHGYDLKVEYKHFPITEEEKARGWSWRSEITLTPKYPKITHVQLGNGDEAGPIHVRKADGSLVPFDLEKAKLLSSFAAMESMKEQDLCKAITDSIDALASKEISESHLQHLLLEAVQTIDRG